MASNRGGRESAPIREPAGVLIFDEPVVIHCYTTPKDAESQAKLKKLAAFCRRMGRETRQGEIGLVIDDYYYGIRNFKESKS